MLFHSVLLRALDTFKIGSHTFFSYGFKDGSLKDAWSSLGPYYHQFLILLVVAVLATALVHAHLSSALLGISSPLFLFLLLPLSQLNHVTALLRIWSLFTVLLSPWVKLGEFLKYSSLFYFVGRGIKPCPFCSGNALWVTCSLWTTVIVEKSPHPSSLCPLVQALPD